jgi:hypothetical protein
MKNADIHPLMSDGEPVYKAPAAVVAACKAAIDRGATSAGPFAAAFAEHVVEGEMIGLGVLEKLADFMAGARLPDRVAKGGQALADAVDLLGGEAALSWARGVLIKAGRIHPTAEGERAEKVVNVLKVDDTLGLVFGWAIVSTEDGEPYFDTQGDWIPEESMMKAAADFMGNSRVLGDMHQTAEGGAVVFAFPLTAEVAKAFGIVTKTTGLMIGVKPANAETLAKFKSGEYSGFSIGGRRILDEAA